MDYNQKIKKLEKELNDIKIERNREILEMREKGKTLNEIGIFFGLTREAVRLIILNNSRVLTKSKK
ncbi:MAG: sigma factor-like helix-turn-helix DNA-binding protein [Candidatus Moraniibacteriota bacterium]